MDDEDADADDDDDDEKGFTMDITANISSAEDGVSVLVLQLCTIIIIYKHLERAENAVRAWRELLSVREDVVRT